ncbi:MAG: hypothetical protein PHW56_09180 [Methanosarcinaceae archaeon]|nr:hypothetical protein [Methanosarcinaceae archaeon]
MSPTLTEELSKEENFIPGEDLPCLLRAYFPGIGESGFSGAALHLRKLNDPAYVTLVLEEGTEFFECGNDLFRSYLETAARVCEFLSGEKDLESWLALAGRLLALDRACTEGFFEASVLILKERDMAFLEEWTKTGFLLSSVNSRPTPTVAASYFTYTSKPALSVEFGRFKEWVDTGLEFAKYDLKAARAYFKALPDISSLFQRPDFNTWTLILKRVLEKDRKGTAEIISQTAEVFFAVLPGQRPIFLKVLKEFVELDVSSALALLKNGPLALSSLSSSDFREWAATAAGIAKQNPETAVSFLSKSPRLLGDIEFSEFSAWAKQGTALLSSGPVGAKAFFEGSFEGLGNALSGTDPMERAYLLDVGAGLAARNPGCAGIFFENAPWLFKRLSRAEFEEWVDIGRAISGQSTFYGSNYYKSSVLALKKLNPENCREVFSSASALLKKDRVLAGVYFENLSRAGESLHPKEISKWVEIGLSIYKINKEISISYFKTSPGLLKDLDISELEEWAFAGTAIFENNPLKGRLYFTLKSRKSKAFVEKLMKGAALKRVVKTLKYYAIGLSGVYFTIRSKTLLPGGVRSETLHPVVSGRTLYLEPRLRQYGDFEDNFRVYKLSIIHELGHINYGASGCEMEAAAPLLERISGRYGSGLPESVGDPGGRDKAGVAGRDNFVVSGRDTPPASGGDKSAAPGIESVSGALCEEPLQEEETEFEFSKFLSLFPNLLLASDILGVLEDARVEYRTLNYYRGLRRDFEKGRKQMLSSRAPPVGLPEQFVEALLWLSTGFEPAFEVDCRLGEVLGKTRKLLQKKIFRPEASGLDSLETTFELYTALEDSVEMEGREPLKSVKYKLLQNLEYRGKGIGVVNEDRAWSEEFLERILERFMPGAGVELEEEEEEGGEAVPVYAMERNWPVRGSYSYDEWDGRVNDYRPDWCTLHEVEPVGESGEFYEKALGRYSNEISLIRRIFQMMRPETFRKLRAQADGDEIDIDAVTDAFIERRCGINPDPRLYTRRDKRERNVATLFLVDVSVSTEKKLDEGGRSILDVEKDSLIIMSQALESIGDKYGIYAFSGRNRGGVEYYAVKDFEEEISEAVARRISVLEPVYNTRLGPAIRHSIAKLKAIEAKTKVLVLLSDGEPYDINLGDEKYQGYLAMEDTRMAIQEGKAMGMHFFCITVDREANDYLDLIFSDVGYTIIDNAATLPERLPMLYKRITT